MNDNEKIECAKDYRDITLKNLLFAERRSSELDDKFTELEVQIATLLLGFSGLFLKYFSVNIHELFDSLVLIFFIKIIYALNVFLLILSLVIGIIHITRKEKFWEEQMVVRQLRTIGWNKCIRKEKSFEEAFSYDNGTVLDKGGIIYSPKWTWILQTVFLATAIMLIFVLFLISLFN